MIHKSLICYTYTDMNAYLKDSTNTAGVPNDITACGWYRTTMMIKSISVCRTSEEYIQMWIYFDEIR